MGKQRSIEMMNAGETLESPAGGRVAGTLPTLFEDHFRLASKSMTPEHAAASAHDAVQRHLASVREAKEGEAMK